jgi:hypothetical protein
MNFAFDERELRRGAMSMLETNIMMSSLICCLILILVFCLARTLVLRLTLFHMLCRALLVFCLSSLMDLTIADMVWVHKRTAFMSRCFRYGSRPRRGDRFSRRPDFPAGGFYTHFESRHLDVPCFLCRGSHPTQPNGELQKIVKTFSSCMIKCWIPKIYLTNSSTEPSTFSDPV